MKWARIRAVVILLVILLGGALLAHRAQVAAAWRQSGPGQASSAAAGAYTPAAGPYQAESVNDLVLHDAKRSKDLHLKVTYPQADGMFPVIVFSHG